MCTSLVYEFVDLKFVVEFFFYVVARMQCILNVYQKNITSLSYGVDDLNLFHERDALDDMMLERIE